MKSHQSASGYFRLLQQPAALYYVQPITCIAD